MKSAVLHVSLRKRNKTHYKNTRLWLNPPTLSYNELLDWPPQPTLTQVKYEHTICVKHFTEWLLQTFPNDGREMCRRERQRGMKRIDRVWSIQHLLWLPWSRGAALCWSLDIHPEEPLCLHHKSEWSGSYPQPHHPTTLPSRTKLHILPRKHFIQTK